MKIIILITFFIGSIDCDYNDYGSSEATGVRRSKINQLYYYDDKINIMSLFLISFW